MIPKGTGPAELFSLAAEQGVLGSLLADQDGSTIIQVRTILDPHDFFIEAHAELYGAMLCLADQSRKTNTVNMAEELERRGILDQVGLASTRGSSYLTYLVGAVPIYAHAAEYAQTVRRYSLRRGLLGFAQRLARASHDTDDPEVIITSGLTDLAGMGSRVRAGLISASDAVDEFEPKARQWLSNPQDVYGIPSGLVDLDRMTGGLEPTEFVLIAGRPSVGKSALALQIARHAAETGHPVAYFSLEMSLPRIMLRLASSVAQIDSDAIRHGKVGQNEPKLWEALAHITRLPMWFHCVAGVTVGQIDHEIAKLRASQQVDMVVIDYIQLMGGEGDNENLKLTHISNGLARLAKAHNVVLVGLSQLSRSVESRLDPQPKLADLRGSGSLEQDADKILFLWRDPKEEELSTNGEQDQMAALRLKKRPRSAPMCLAKNRDGISGIANLELLFWGRYQTFLSKAEHVDEPF